MKAKAKPRRVLAIDKYAQVPRDMQVAARLLDDRDLVKRMQKALGERHARDDRIDYAPAGGEQVEDPVNKLARMIMQHQREQRENVMTRYDRLLGFV